MSPTYEQDELADQLNRYDKVKAATEKACSREIGNQEDTVWAWDDVWGWAQEAYHDHSYDHVEEQVKFADAAYYRVQSNVDNPDWTEVKQRIGDFVIPRHVDVQHSDDMPDYLPGAYTSLATVEIVVHAVTLEITESQ